MSAAVIIAQDGTAEVSFEFCYSAVEEIKARIPVYARSWNPERKVWTIASGPFVPVAIDILEDIFGAHSVHIHDDRTERHQPDGAPPQDAYATLHLRSSAPPQLIQAAYRCLSRLNHPDKGGDTATMQAINAAYESLRDQLSSSRTRDTAA